MSILSFPSGWGICDHLRHERGGGLEVRRRTPEAVREGQGELRCLQRHQGKPINICIGV